MRFRLAYQLTHNVDAASEGPTAPGDLDQPVDTGVFATRRSPTGTSATLCDARNSHQAALNAPFELGPRQPDPVRFSNTFWFSYTRFHLPSATIKDERKRSNGQHCSAGHAILYPTAPESWWEMPIALGP